MNFSVQSLDGVWDDNDFGASRNIRPGRLFFSPFRTHLRRASWGQKNKMSNEHAICGNLLFL